MTKGLGDVILERYVVEEVWLHTSLVYRIRDRERPSECFIAKCVSPEYRNNQVIVDWFSREANIWQKVCRHANIVELVDSMRKDVADNTDYFFIEYVDGKNLDAIISATHAGSLSYPQVLDWASQVASAMEYATEKNKNGTGVYVHRDLEPSNIMITRQACVKVNDWGLGKNLDEPESKIKHFTFRDLEKNRIVGKPGYMPPEQFPPRRGKGYTVSGDIYYFGSMLFRMLTGNYVNPEEMSLDLMQARTEKEVKESLERHHLQKALPQARTLCPDEAILDLLADCIAIDERKRIQSFTTLVSRLAEIRRQVRFSRLAEDYLICEHCSFITGDIQQSCPVCEGRQTFKKWKPREEDPVEIEGAVHTKVEPSRGESHSPRARPREPGTSVEGMVYIQGGKVLIGMDRDLVAQLAGRHGLSGDQLEQLSSPAQGRLQLTEFWISRFAVSNDEYSRFVEATGWRAPAHWSAGIRKSNPTAFGELPVVNVNFFDAEAYCQWKGVRLPTNEEWERAARGSEGFRYPWGNHYAPLAAVKDEESTETFFANTLERHKATGEELISVKGLPDGASPGEVFNMAGNSWEWVDGGEEEMKHTRGGSWRYPGDLYAVTWYRLPTPMEVLQNDIGFRCAHDGFEKNGTVRELSSEELSRMMRVDAGKYPIGINQKELHSLARQFELTDSDMETFERNRSRIFSCRSFRIRKYLVTNEEYYQFVLKTDRSWPKHWRRGLLRWSDRPFLTKYADHPVTSVNFEEAKAFCEWMGGRLPYNEEWECAIRGEAGSIYPWGEHFDPTRCNVSETGLARTSSVHAFSNGESPMGCIDMAGNVREWTKPDGMTGRYYARGGSFRCSGPINSISFLLLPVDPKNVTADLGFRFVLD